jgi:sec-independent protein translocase protein TatB
VFDFSVWELVVIGGVALVVIGPERLPRVARTAGHLLGRFQRYVADVKSDINREIELAELKKLQTTVQDAARDIQQTVKEGMTEAEKQLKEAEGEIKSAGEEIKKTGEELTSGFMPPHMGTAISTPEPSSPLPTSSPVQSIPEVEYDPRAAALNPDMAASYAAAKAKTEISDPPVDAPEEPSPQLELGLPAEPDPHHKPG